MNVIYLFFISLAILTFSVGWIGLVGSFFHWKVKSDGPAPASVLQRVLPLPRRSDIFLFGAMILGLFLLTALFMQTAGRDRMNKEISYLSERFSTFFGPAVNVDVQNVRAAKTYPDALTNLNIRPHHLANYQLGIVDADINGSTQQLIVIASEDRDFLKMSGQSSLRLGGKDIPLAMTPKVLSHLTQFRSRLSEVLFIVILQATVVSLLMGFGVYGVYLQIARTLVGRRRSIMSKLIPVLEPYRLKKATAEVEPFWRQVLRGSSLLYRCVTLDQQIAVTLAYAPSVAETEFIDGFIINVSDESENWLFFSQQDIEELRLNGCEFGSSHQTKEVDVEEQAAA